MTVKPTAKQISIMAHLFERAYVDGRHSTLAGALSWRVKMDHKTLFLVLPSLAYRGLIHYGGLGYDSLDWYPPCRRKHEQYEITIQPGALDGIATMLTRYLRPGHPAWEGLTIYNQHSQSGD